MSRGLQPTHDYRRFPCDATNLLIFHGDSGNWIDVYSIKDGLAVVETNVGGFIKCPYYFDELKHCFYKSGRLCFARR